MAERTFTVGAEAGGASCRLDAFLRAALPALSRRLVRRVIAGGAVRVNGRPAQPGHHLRAGDLVSVPDLPARLRSEPDLALPVLYEDEHLIALDKPGGMPAHALAPWQTGTAAAFLLARYPETEHVGDVLAPGLVHRLDTGTSGLLLAARTGAAHSSLRAALRARTVEKHYLAIVEATAGGLRPERVEVALAHDPQDRRRMVPAWRGARAWHAETCLEPLGDSGPYRLVLATIRTGVTHQVRAHLALLGYPVLNDALYGGPPAELPLGRHALHAARLSLAHPVDGRPLRLSCPLPADLQRFVPGGFP